MTRFSTFALLALTACAGEAPAPPAPEPLPAAPAPPAAPPSARQIPAFGQVDVVTKQVACVHHLDGHGAIQQRVDSLVDHAHATRPELLLEAVGANGARCFGGQQPSNDDVTICHGPETKQSAACSKTAQVLGAPGRAHAAKSGAIALKTQRNMA